MKYLLFALLISSTFAFYNVDKIFFASVDHTVLYIDFDGINAQVKTIIVTLQGETVLQDRVDALPQNTIYELDFTRLGCGSFEIELHLDDGNVIRHTNLYLDKPLTSKAS